MKLFNSVQELWSHCAFCPVCREICREVIVDTAIYDPGDSEFFQDIATEKTDKYLIIRFGPPMKRAKAVGKMKKQFGSYVESYTIDCTNNTFQFITPSSEPKVLSVYIQSICKECGSASYGSDMELDINLLTVHNIGLDREFVELSDEKKRYSLDYYFGNEVSPGEGIFVSQIDIDYVIDADEDRELGVKLPLMELDFSDKSKVINKLKTLILFS